MEQKQKQSDMNEIKEMFDFIRENMQVMDGKLSDVIKELRDTKLENAAMKTEIKAQGMKIANLEREIRKKNLIFKGIMEDEKEDFELTKHKTIKICESLGVPIKPEFDVDQVRRIGKQIPGKPRPILLQLTTTNKKFEILGKTKGLRGSNIWIDEDYPKEIQEERKILVSEMKEAWKKGEKAQLRYNKLIINDKVYDASNIINRESTSQYNNADKKRKPDMRSPENDKFGEQLRNITRTSKN